MQTPTFRCGQCGNLMAVANQYLGQQVQCPTCKQVVLAPTPTPTPMPEPAPTPEVELVPSVPLESISPPTPTPPAPLPSLSIDTEHESIFTERSGDDLFDEPAPTLAPSPEYSPQPEPQPVFESVPVLQPAEEQPEPMPLSQQVNWAATQAESPVVEEPRQAAGWSPTTEAEPAGEQPARRRKGPELNWLLLLMIPLISYSVLATGLIFYLWNRMEAVRSSVANPLESMPDIHGDAPGAKKKTVATWKPASSQALAELPYGHTIHLGEKVIVGNLEVTPVRVERGKVAIKVASFNAEPAPYDSLILRLQLRNLSDEYSFAPMDNAFDRKWNGIPVDKVPPLNYKPFTVLVAGKDTYFGGTAKWVPLKRPASLKDFYRMWMEGRGDLPAYLDPGQTVESFTATDGDNEQLVDKVLKYPGELLWRVHLRQGPVKVPHRTELIPSTTVIGVRFKAGDVVTQ